MSRNRNETLETIGRLRVGAIIRTKDRNVAADAVRAAIAGGFRSVEFTLNTPGALDLIAEFAENRDLLVGAGTVMSAEQTRQAVEAGACYIVAPNCDAEVIAESRRLDVVSVPGTYTPTEMVTAHRLGADMVKLFPAPADIPLYVRQLVGPLPELRIYPTAGVTPDNFLDVLAAGAYGVGFVSSLFRPDDLARKDFGAVERRAADITRRAHRG